MHVLGQAREEYKEINSDKEKTTTKKRDNYESVTIFLQLFHPFFLHIS